MKYILKTLLYLVVLFTGISVMTFLYVLVNLWDFKLKNNSIQYYDAIKFLILDGYKIFFKKYFN